MKVVVLGGYGNFGARICRALAGDPHIELVVAARDAQRAAAFASSLASPARAIALDTTSPDFGERLRSAAPGLVVHTAGPFQGQGYAVAQAAASCGAHYIDLADGRRFVCDFAAALDAPFCAARGHQRRKHGAGVVVGGGGRAAWALRRAARHRAVHRAGAAGAARRSDAGRGAVVLR
jgi:saccharopine dehydrogenase-like NADP-dependent oxidoreductase